MSLSDQQWSPASTQVTVLQARGLRIKGKSGTNDAYAVMQVGKDKYQTSVVEKSVAPVWKEEAAFDLPQQGGGGGGGERGTLRVHVLHRALVGPDKLLGQAVINLLQLSEDRTRNKTEWFKLLDKTGKPDKDRGEVLVDIQFTRNNMTASMFDLSAAGKSRSRLGKLKDKVRGKKKESDASSNVVPSFSMVLTDSEEEGNQEGGEAAAGKDEKKKKHKMKSLFSNKSNLQKNMSQSMSVLPGKNSSLSGSQTSGLNVEAAEGKKKFKFMIHKRSGSSDSKDSSAAQKHVEQSNLCINGSHVYCEEQPPRTARVGSNYSLASSGHGSMEDVPESSPPSVDSLRTVRQYSPWTEEEEEEEAEGENKREDMEEMRIKEEQVRRQEMEKRRIEEAERMRIEEERIRKEKERAEEEERVRREEEEECKRLEEKRRLEEQEEEKRIQREEQKRMEDERRKEEEEMVRRLEEERARLAEEKRRQEEEERNRIEKEKARKEEEERMKREVERAEEERRREEERVRRLEEERERLAEEKRRQEEEERNRIEEEKARKEEEERMKREVEKAEEERRRRKEEERMRRLEEERERLAEEKRRQEERNRIEEEEARKEEEERIRREEQRAKEERRRREEEEERVRRLEEECERLAEEKRRQEEEERNRIEEERMRREEEEKRRQEEERVRRLEEERERLAEEKRRQEEERNRIEGEKARKEQERMKREEERAEEERRQEEERLRRLEEEKRILEEEERRKRKEEEESIREEEERRRKEEEARKEKEEHERLVAEKKKLEEEERKRIEEENIRREEEERKGIEETRRKEEEAERVRRQKEEQRRIEEEEKRRREEEEKIMKEEKARKEKEEHERLAEEKTKLEEAERKRIEEEERLRKEEQERIKTEEEERIRREEEERVRKEKEETERSAEEMRLKELEEERIRAQEKEKKEEETQKLEEKKNEAGKRSRASAAASALNPFEEDVSNNPFDEIPDSPAAAGEFSVQRRCPDVPDVSAREKRQAPRPPGKNQAERRGQRETDASTQRLVQNKPGKEKDVKTASVLPVPALRRSPTDTKSNQSSTLSSKGAATAATAAAAAKHTKRPAPSRPLSAEEKPIPKPKTSHGVQSEAKKAPVVHSLNPFDEDEDEVTAQDDGTASGHGAAVPWPPAMSQARDEETKIKSAKMARAPAPPEKMASSSTMSKRNTDGDPVTGDTGGPDNSTTQACEQKPDAAHPVTVQQRVVVVHAAEVTGGKKEGSQATSRRLQPVKPLNPLDRQPVSALQEKKENKSTGIRCDIQDNSKVNGSVVKGGPYSQLTQEELISLVLKQENQLSERDKKISELELYIDNLLVRVMEENPCILMSLKKTV